MSIPAGFDSQGRAVGLQIIGDYFAEAKLLNVAHQYQQAPAGIRACRRDSNKVW